MTYCIDTKAPDNYQCFIEQQNNTKFEKGKSIESLFQNVYYVLIIGKASLEVRPKLHYASSPKSKLGNLVELIIFLSYF